jgi:hypothetical protein
MTAAGSTVLVAAAASGVVTLWPSTSQRASAAGLDGGSNSGAEAINAQFQTFTAYDLQHQRHLEDGRLAAQRTRQAEARRAARRARERALRLAAERRAAQRAAEQEAAEQQAPSGSPQQIALGMLPSYGWSSGQFSCLDSLWTRESDWNVHAENSVSGAYGIPQALPASKMASAGPDWQNDAATQIKWGLGYIQATYGSPCAAWAHEEADGWY